MYDIRLQFQIFCRTFLPFAFVVATQQVIAMPPCRVAPKQEVIKREQWKQEVLASWEAVDSTFEPDLIFGTTGYQLVLAHAIRASNHPFVTGMTLLGSMCPLMNGASVAIFPGQESPINVICTLVNYPQTRKSQHTKLVKVIADVLL